MTQPEICYDDEHIQLLYRPGASPFTLATFSNYGFAGNGSTFWGKGLCDAEDIETFGFVAKSNNWFPNSAMSKLFDTFKFSLKKPLITYGHSQGGYAALKYAAKLDAAGVIAGAPQFSIDPLLTPKDRRFTHHFIKELHDGMEISAADFAGNIVILYDPHDSADSFHFRKIVDVYPGAQLSSVPIYYIGHSIMDVLRHRNVIVNLFDEVRNGTVLVKSFNQAKVSKKKSYNYSYRLAERLLSSGKPRTALGVLLTVINNNNGYIDPPYRSWQALIRSKAHRAAGMMTEALTQAELAIDLQPTDLRFRSWLTECLVATKQVNKTEIII